MAWQLLLESDRELSACAAALFILCAVKAPTVASEIMHADLKHAEPDVRYLSTRNTLSYTVYHKNRFRRQ